MNRPRTQHLIEGSMVSLRLQNRTDSVRRREPVTCGIPWPKGLVREVGHLVLLGSNDQPLPLQSQALDRWADGSVRWALLDWQASTDQGQTYRVGVCEEAWPPVVGSDQVTVQSDDQRITVETGIGRFILRRGSEFPFESVQVRGEDAISACTFSGGACRGPVYGARIDKIEVAVAGPLRTSVRLWGKMAFCYGKAAPLADWIGRLDFFAGSATVGCDLTLRNPGKADHPDGFWDLGNAGSIYLQDASLILSLPPGEAKTTVRFSAESGLPLEEVAGDLEIYQDSSGGVNWRSSNHVNRCHIVPHEFCGYRLTSDQTQRQGKRATPVVFIERGERTVGIAMPHFWQNFPKAIQAVNIAEKNSPENSPEVDQRDPPSLLLSLFPQQFGDTHEIQGGEQKTHTFYMAFERDTVTDVPLDWVRDPMVARADPSWYCTSGAIPYLITKTDDPNDLYNQLVDAAIQGDDTFEHKREMVDEYGWRHFGDVWGDHEAVRNQGDMPLTSHYNNQYDGVRGLAVQFMRSGDIRWHDLMNEMAAHTIDIDIYHTDQDKSAYNHGLFWHTWHYGDADTSTHRTYPASAKQGGGGPSGGHLYAHGLMLHYFMTGNPLSRETVVELGQYVIDADDGTKTVFRWFDGGATGHVTESAPNYHGPGRAAGNSLNTLLDAHRLTGEQRFLDKAEQIVRRVVHPDMDIEALDLLDAESRWFYNLFLQALGGYLDYKADRGDLDWMYTYGRQVLLNFAAWMADHEYPYLDKPEILVYPTETWAAQDMRKCEVFNYAAKHALGNQREQFLERARFFFEVSTKTLARMPTRTLCRPVTMMLSYGYMQGYMQRHPAAAAPPPEVETCDFGPQVVFVAQKKRAIRRFKMIAVAGAVAALGVLSWLAYAIPGW